MHYNIKPIKIDYCTVFHKQTCKEVAKFIKNLT